MEYPSTRSDDFQVGITRIQSRNRHIIFRSQLIKNPRISPFRHTMNQVGVHRIRLLGLRSTVCFLIPERRSFIWETVGQTGTTKPWAVPSYSDWMPITAMFSPMDRITTMVYRPGYLKNWGWMRMNIPPWSGTQWMGIRFMLCTGTRFQRIRNQGPKKWAVVFG